MSLDLELNLTIDDIFKNWIAPGTKKENPCSKVSIDIDKQKNTYFFVLYLSIVGQSLNRTTSRCIKIIRYYFIFKKFERHFYDYSILISKHSSVEFKGNVLSWFIRYLFGRTQVVKAVNTLSASIMVYFGIPWGFFTPYIVTF